MLSQLALKDMIPSQSGSIVNISSGAAIGPGRGPYSDIQVSFGNTCYGAEKAALERFSQGLAQEVKQYGISVTCVSPSQVVPTPGTIYHNLISGLDDPNGENPDLMAKADLAISAAGSTCWELAYLGLPAILIITSENQTMNLEYLKQKGAFTYVNNQMNISTNMISGKINQLIMDKKLRNKMSRTGKLLVDGIGRERVVKTLQTIKIRVGENIKV